MFRVRDSALAIAAAFGLALTPALSADDFPIAGLYTKDQVCKGDGTDPTELLVRITREEIRSDLGQCAILSSKRDGKGIAMHLSCKMPGDLVILGDVTVTVRDENTLDFIDQDRTSPAVLHKCRK